MASSSKKSNPRVLNSSLLRSALTKLGAHDELTKEELHVLPQNLRNLYIRRSNPQSSQKSLYEDEEKKIPKEVQRVMRHVEDNLSLSIDEEQIWKEAGRVYYKDQFEEHEKIRKSRAAIERDLDREDTLAEAVAELKAKQEAIRIEIQSIAEKNKVSELTDRERELLDYKFLTNEEIRDKAEEMIENGTYPSGEVKLDAMLVLDDIITDGSYTLQDVNLVAEGAAALQKDPSENSPIQFLDKIVESVKKQTQNALKTPTTGQFFNPIDVDVLSRESPLQINEIVKASAAGIDLLQDRFDQNDAQVAIGSYVKAMVMLEAETKIREAVRDAQAKKDKMDQQTTDQSMAESAAIAAAFSQTTPSPLQNLGFNITEEEFDISFTPDDDPDVYKPLEIISYMAMTDFD